MAVLWCEELRADDRALCSARSLYLTGLESIWMTRTKAERTTKTDVQRNLKMSAVVSSTPCPDLEEDDDDARAFHVVDLS